MKKNFIFKRILLFLLLIIPCQVLAYSNKIIPGGETIGIEVNSSGVLVVGFYEVNNTFPGKNAGFKKGDLITHINNNKIKNIDEMINKINEIKDNKINFKIIRNKVPLNINLKIQEDNTSIIKTGLYVKDKINGVGTISYIDPESKIFGALGHEIIENNTASKFEIKDGKIYEANISNIVRSKIGRAGEKNATFNRNNIYGDVKENTYYGIYGTYAKNIDEYKTLDVGKSDDVTTGKALIRTVIENNKPEEFTINIIKLLPNNKNKNILFEITDKRLLDKTGGIIQGMSGSPIIQNNKIIGAVNYVILNDPKRGYGVFITKMLEEGEN